MENPKVEVTEDKGKTTITVQFGIGPRLVMHCYANEDSITIKTPEYFLKMSPLDIDSVVITFGDFI